MQKKRLLAAGLVTAMTCTTILAGCATGGGGSSSGGNETSDGKKEVVIWDYFETDAQKQMMQDLVDGFNESQDEYVASHVYVPFAD